MQVAQYIGADASAAEWARHLWANAECIAEDWPDRVQERKERIEASLRRARMRCRTHTFPGSLPSEMAEQQLSSCNAILACYAAVQAAPADVAATAWSAHPAMRTTLQDPSSWVLQVPEAARVHLCRSCLSGSPHGPKLRLHMLLPQQIDHIVPLLQRLPELRCLSISFGLDFAKAAAVPEPEPPAKARKVPRRACVAKAPHPAPATPAHTISERFPAARALLQLQQVTRIALYVDWQVLPPDQQAQSAFRDALHALLADAGTRLQKLTLHQPRCQPVRRLPDALRTLSSLKKLSFDSLPLTPGDLKLIGTQLCVERLMLEVIPEQKPAPWWLREEGEKVAKPMSYARQLSAAAGALTRLTELDIVMPGKQVSDCVHIERALRQLPQLRAVCIVRSHHAAACSSRLRRPWPIGTPNDDYEDVRSLFVSPEHFVGALSGCAQVTRLAFAGLRLSRSMHSNSTAAFLYELARQQLLLLQHLDLGDADFDTGYQAGVDLSDGAGESEFDPECSQWWRQRWIERFGEAALQHGATDHPVASDSNGAENSPCIVSDGSTGERIRDHTAGNDAGSSQQWDSDADTEFGRWRHVSIHKFSVFAIESSLERLAHSSPRLRHLDLRRASLHHATDGVWQAMFALPLTYLNLASSGPRPKPLLGALPQLTPTLQHLVLLNIRLRQHTAQLSEALAPLAHLTHLNLAACRLNSKTWPVLAPALAGLPSLAVLDVSRNVTICRDDATLVPLTEQALPSMTALQSIDLSNTGIKTAGERAVMSAVACLTRLTRLDVRFGADADEYTPARTDHELWIARKQLLHPALRERAQ